MTRVGALRWLNVGWDQPVGLEWYSLARPFQGNSELRASSEGLGFVALESGGSAPGWFHRAANTSRCCRWKDHEPVLLWPCVPTGSPPNQTTIFFLGVFTTDVPGRWTSSRDAPRIHIVSNLHIIFTLMRGKLLEVTINV